ncbi:type III pantothenate kinase [Lacinutrix sp. C3R15]|uniref:type III pantothenate kinase n=1 Tax=Flavobacteriaceae TaxID=49546 RepID=UPI001C08C675|nr:MULTISPECIES: type III pantothenate kinase [Flavobacteriaceae]MBU2939175.1 type III pantothenate kinase [Lacinutrix sp. C3R15]MDO6622491.1 type III pantothenate kinase [Oceanihabitans sp. 1_MG-2023]
MNLIIDVGNSFVKLAVFKQDKIIDSYKVRSKDVLKTLRLIRKEYKNIDKTIFSSVGKLKKTDLTYLEKYYKTIILSHETKVPFKNLYGTPKTLGIDRIALVSASVQQYSNKNVLIIDAGTCITFDFITNKNQYVGGAISPGIRMRYDALHHFTANLPLLKTEMPKNIIGDSTTSAMHSGVIKGVLHEIDGAIQEYKSKYPDLTVILTGGDTKFLSKQLKSSIFANSNFLLEGLNFILQYNTH